MSDTRDEVRIFSRLQAIDKGWKLSYVEAGMLCKEVQDRLLWRERCASFAEWMKRAAPYGYAQAWAALRDIEALSDVPAEHLIEIPQANFPILKQLSTHVRAEPSVLHMAKTARSDEFAEHVEREHPEMHIETRRTMRFHPEASAAERIEAALSMAFGKGARTRDEALELVCEEAADVWRCEAEIEGILAAEGK
jgi:hypothetical protein